MDHVESRVDQSSAVSMADMLKHVSITILEYEDHVIVISLQVRMQKDHLMVKLKETETHKKYFEQQLDKKQQQLKQYEELQSSLGSGDIWKEFKNLEESVDEVRATIDKMELVKLQCVEMVCKEQILAAVYLLCRDGTLGSSQSLFYAK